MTHDDLDSILKTMPDYARLKPWKINGIWRTLHDIPAIAKDEIRLSNYLAGCMLMEGIDPSSIALVVPKIAEASK